MATKDGGEEERDTGVPAAEAITVVIVHREEAHRKENVRSLDYQHLQALVRSSFPSLFPTQTNLSNVEEGDSKTEEDDTSFVIVGRVPDSEPHCEISFEMSSDRHVKMAIQFATNEWKELCCPISHELMQNPVVASDGHTYERDEIEHWFRVCRHRGDALPTSPMTNTTLNSTRLEPDDRLRERIEVRRNSGALGVTVRFELVRAVEWRRHQANFDYFSRNEENLHRGPWRKLRKMKVIIEGLMRMVLDPTYPIWPKMLAMTAVVYACSPMDAIPDAIPVFGVTDDFLVLTGTVSTLAAMGYDIATREKARARASVVSA